MLLLVLVWVIKHVLPRFVKALPDAPLVRWRQIGATGRYLKLDRFLSRASTIHQRGQGQVLNSLGAG